MALCVFSCPPTVQSQHCSPSNPSKCPHLISHPGFMPRPFSLLLYNQKSLSGPTDVSILTHTHSGIQQHFLLSLLRRHSGPFPSPASAQASQESPFLPSLTPPPPSRNSWFICNLLRETSPCSEHSRGFSLVVVIPSVMDYVTLSSFIP